MYTMPFGKHIGCAIDELPDGYLKWLRELDDLREPLRWHVEREYRYRFEGGPDPGDEEPPKQKKKQQQSYGSGFQYDFFGGGGSAKSAPDPADGLGLSAAEHEIYADVVKAGYRALAIKWHPDSGGDTEKMKQLNLVMQKLRGILT